MIETVSSDIHYDRKADSKNQLAVEAPPSPQLTQEDLILQDLEVKHRKHQAFISPTSSADLLTPQSEERSAYLYTATTPFINGSQPRQAAEQMADSIIREFNQLVFWEIPGRSAIVFFSILFTLILTRYYSLLYLFAGAFTILTAFNLVFVNLYNLVRSAWAGLPMSELDHPYRIGIYDNATASTGHPFTHAYRNLIEHYIHKFVDLLDLLCHQALKIMLVENSKRTLIACSIAYMVYIMNHIVSLKTFLILTVCALFTIPRYYQQNQPIVDEQIEWVQSQCKTSFDKYSNRLVDGLRCTYDTYGGEHFLQVAQPYLTGARALLRKYGDQLTKQKQNQQNETKSAPVATCEDPQKTQE